MAFEAAKVLEDNRWSRVYELPSGQVVYASKFLTDNLTVSLHDVVSNWETWSDQEKLDFAKAYKFKPAVSSEDAEILSFLMVNADDRVLVCIARQLANHPDRDRAFLFLINRLRLPSSEPKANFISAIRAIGSRDAILVLREFHDASGAQLERAKDKETSAVADFLHCCSALSEIDSNGLQYRQELQSYLASGNETIRLVALGLLQRGSAAE